MSTKKPQPVSPSLVTKLFTIFQKPTTQQSADPGCRCRHGKRRCGAPTLKSKDGLCTWCRKGHPDHSHHDEHREKPARTQKTRRH